MDKGTIVYDWSKLMTEAGVYQYIPNYTFALAIMLSDKIVKLEERLATLEESIVRVKVEEET